MRQTKLFPETIHRIVYIKCLFFFVARKVMSEETNTSLL